MITVIALVGKVFAVTNLAWCLWLLWSAWRRHQVDTDYICLLGIAASSVVIQWAAALVSWLAWASWLLCVAIFCVSMIKQWRARKRRRAELEAERQRLVDEAWEEWLAVWASEPSEEVIDDQRN